MTKCVRIEYTIKPDINLGEVKENICIFVDAIANHYPDHRYTSFQSSVNDREFVHFGESAEDVLPDFQSRPFFRAFSAFLRERCESGPRVTPFSRVASTR